jgi:phage baseplate assembly protein W
VADDKHLLTDLKLRLLHHELRPIYTVETESRRIVTRQGASQVDDMAVISGTDNLAQAILMRLLTPLGELSELAHPEYGSRLFELIGQSNTETTRNRIKLTILEAVQQEPRVAKVVTLNIEAAKPPPAVLGGSMRTETDRHLVTVLLQVQPVGPAPIVTIGPFTLEL